MLVEKIISRQNPLVRRFRRVRAGNDRHLMLLEGVRLVEDAVRAGIHFEIVAFTSDLESSSRGLALIDSLQRVRCRGAHVTRQVMDALSDTESAQGVAAIASRPHHHLEDLFKRAPQLIVIADRLQDPGNLGAIIRTAEAAGANGLITTPHTVDPFNHKALRASMGSAFRLPVVVQTASADIVGLCERHKVKLAVTHTRPDSGRIEDAARSVRLYTQADLSGPVAFVLGSEASGVPGETALHSDLLIHIPMVVGIESLNVAAAAAIFLYEAARQRNFDRMKSEGRRKRMMKK
jgi:TrmH family RNA methyltransferase